LSVDYRNLVKVLVLVDTTSHGIGGPDAAADAFLAAADKRGLKKAVHNLSDISFSTLASPALLEWARREVIPRNSSPGQRFARFNRILRKFLDGIPLGASEADGMREPQLRAGVVTQVARTT
jgi:hypothetical protein